MITVTLFYFSQQKQINIENNNDEKDKLENITKNIRL